MVHGTLVHAWIIGAAMPSPEQTFFWKHDRGHLLHAPRMPPMGFMAAWAHVCSIIFSIRFSAMATRAQSSEDPVFPWIFDQNVQLNLCSNALCTL